MKSERAVVEPLITSSKITFYIRHVDDTLSLAKEEDIKLTFGKFNSFLKNLIFTIGSFGDNNKHCQR